MRQSGIFTTTFILVLLQVSFTLAYEHETYEHYNLTDTGELIFERPLQVAPKPSLWSSNRSNQNRSGILQNIAEYRQSQVWKMIGLMDTFKTNNRLYSR